MTALFTWTGAAVWFAVLASMVLLAARGLPVAISLFRFEFNRFMVNREHRKIGLAKLAWSFTAEFFIHWLEASLGWWGSRSIQTHTGRWDGIGDWQVWPKPKVEIHEFRERSDG